MVSVDTYKPAVAAAAIAAGAVIVNDVSGLRDPALADVCARDRRGARAHAHARGAQAAPAGSGRCYDDVTADVVAFLARADARSRARAGCATSS